MHFVSSRWDADALNPSATEPDLHLSLRRLEVLTSPTRSSRYNSLGFSKIQHRLWLRPQKKRIPTISTLLYVLSQAGRSPPGHTSLPTRACCNY